uniref:Mitochondrial resolvase Ydc2 catalytic domain-containing protein n=1 Tax=viral metagenome TaxID=1070528 RepID=A0A6C0JX91_9ZZZZ
MSNPKKVLTFDIGIRNLAWCLLEKKDTSWKILGWENYDLLAGTSSQEAKQKDNVLCVTCGKRAGFSRATSTPRCAKHCEDGFPPLRDLSGALLKKIPDLKTLKVLAEDLRPAPKGKTKVAIVEGLAKKFSMPLISTKATRAKTDDTASLHNSIQTFVKGKLPIFHSATHILLENQPAFKNPTMKTVQILLFATLRDYLLPVPWVGFVHAGKKVQGKEKGDAGYSSRKKGSEDRVKEFFEKNTVDEKEHWVNLLAGNQKKSDLCDTLCMCLDQLV